MRTRSTLAVVLFDLAALAARAAPAALALALAVGAGRAHAMRPAPRPPPAPSWPWPGAALEPDARAAITLVCRGEPTPTCEVRHGAASAPAIVDAEPDSGLLGPMPAQGRHLALGPPRDGITYRVAFADAERVDLALDLPPRWEAHVACAAHGDGGCALRVVAFELPARGVGPGGVVLGLLVDDASPQVALHAGYELTLNPLMHAALALEVPLAPDSAGRAAAAAPWRLVPSVRAGLPGTILFLFIGYSLALGVPIDVAPVADVGVRVVLEMSIVAVHLGLVADVFPGLRGDARSDMRWLVSCSF